jgi:16S rRNA (adenine1518-N6/adenine1519-N6)-dimethyltransferase
MSNKLFNPDHLKFLCQKYGLRPSKKYGQNFLINEEVIEQIIETAELKKTDTIVEIGPGFGTLTFALAGQAKNVIAFEIEKKIAPYWEKRSFCPSLTKGGIKGGLPSDDKSATTPVPLLGKEGTHAHPNDNIKIIWGNVLKSAFFQKEKRDLDSTPCLPAGRPALLLARGGRYKVVANLPYQITSSVIRMFLEADNPPTEMILMVQKEVAERICAKPGDMSVLSVAVQYYAEPKIIDIIPHSNFWPEPKVDSAILKLSLRAPAGGVAIPGGCFASLATTREHDKFFQLVKAGFANRRKLLIKNLEPMVGKKNKELLKKAFAQLRIKETARAQELSPEQWSFLTKELF